MRKPKYLSYSAFWLWETDRREFYLIYLAETKVPRRPVQSATLVGTGFHQKVEPYLERDLGLASVCPLLENADVDHVFESYLWSGAYMDLLCVLQDSCDIWFESSREATIAGVPLFGKPDCSFVLPSGRPVILDWKLRGYDSTASPTKGYVLCRDGWWGKQSRSHGKCHKLCVRLQMPGFPAVNCDLLETTSPKWADQISIYAWLLGLEPGDETFIAWVDEIVAKKVPDDQPKLRVATHRAHVGREYQLALLDRLQECWQRIQDGNIFDEDNEERCERAERFAERAEAAGPEFMEATRPMKWS